jgi:hypothetical protein
MGQEKMAGNRIKSTSKKLKGQHVLVVEDHSFVDEILTGLLRLFDHPSHVNSGKEAQSRSNRKGPTSYFWISAFRI